MIVLDLTDPDTPAFHLYSEQFFRMCQRILRPGGMLTLHLGSPVYQAETVQQKCGKSAQGVSSRRTDVAVRAAVRFSLVPWQWQATRSIRARRSTETIAQRIASARHRRAALLPSCVACGAVCAAAVCAGAGAAQSCTR